MPRFASPRQLLSSLFRSVRRSQAPQRRRLFLESLEGRQLLAAFTPGNLLAYRVGTGAGALTNAATAVFVDEFSATTGALVQSIALPTSASGNQHALTAQGTGTSEGLLTRSADGRYLLLTGYDAAPGTKGAMDRAISTTTASAVNRVVGRVDAMGTVDTSTVFQDGFSGDTVSTGIIRGVASADGATIWASGSGADSPNSGGIRVTTFGHTAATATTQLNSTGLRALSIVNGNLYASSIVGSRIVQVGAGLPTTTGQAISNLPGLPTGSPIAFPSEPYQFFLADLSPSVSGPDVLYVAEESSFQNTAYIRKFSLVGGTWVANGNVAVTNEGTRGMVGSVTGGDRKSVV